MTPRPNIIPGTFLPLRHGYEITMNNRRIARPVAPVPAPRFIGGGHLPPELLTLRRLPCLRLDYVLASTGLPLGHPVYVARNRDGERVYTLGELHKISDGATVATVMLSDGVPLPAKPHCCYVPLAAPQEAGPDMRPARPANRGSWTKGNAPLGARAKLEVKK